MARELPSDPTVAEVTRADDRVRPAPVAHGMMPSLAYRVDYGGRSLVFAGHEDELDESLALVRAGYDGEVVLARDGLRLAV